MSFTAIYRFAEAQKMFRTFLIFILITIPCAISAQELIHYDITDGLSGIEVNDIAENENFLWIATSDGLNRFDGENFRIYKRKIGYDNSPGGNNIETLFFDSNGYLWIGLKTGGVDVYDPRHDRFIHLNKLVNGLLPGRVIAINEDSEKNIWLGTWEEGVFRLIPEKTGELSFRSEIHYPGFIVSSVIEKPKGYVRIGTYSGLFVYSLAEHKWSETELPGVAVTQFLDDKTGPSFWCSTWSSGLLNLSWAFEDPYKTIITGKFTDAGLNSIHRIAHAENSKLILGTWGHGVKIFDPASHAGLVSLPSDRIVAPLINCLHRDKSGNIWIGSFGGGVYKLNSGNNNLQYFPIDRPLPAPAVTLADYGEMNILAGTQGRGVYLSNINDGSLSLKFSHIPDDGFSNYILSVYCDDKYVFAGNDGPGMQYSVKGRNNRLVFNEFKGIREFEKITGFFPDRSGNIWVGTKQNGLFSFRFDNSGNHPTDVVHHLTFGREEITGFAALNDNQIFISSHNGLFLFNTSSGKTEENGRIISNEIIYKILGDNVNNCLWIGTPTNLLKLDLSNRDTLLKAVPEDVIPQGAIKVILLDKGNNLWFAVQDHLFCLIHKENRICELNPILLSKKAILSGTVTHLNGVEYLVLGTTDKLIVIDPQKIIQQLKPPAILLTGLDIDYRKVGVGEKIYGNVILNEATEYVKSIRLSHKCRWISLSFAEKNSGLYEDKFQFRIKGFSESWQNLDLSIPVIVSQLNPGKYSFQIRRYGLDKDTGICWSLDIFILAPWWKTITFYILSGIAAFLLIILIIFSVIRFYRNRHLAKLKEIEKQKEDELLKEKESFFAGLSHDLMTPFSLILSPVNDLLRESKSEDPDREKLEIISKNTSFLSDIFGTILDFKRAELSDENLKTSIVEIVSFSNIVLNAFEYLAGSRNIQLTFNSNRESLQIETDNVKIERILYNLISNAIKYTPDGGNVDLSLVYDHAGQLSFAVTDTGCGMDDRNQSVFEKFYREPGKQGSGLGLGLYIVKKFVTLLKGTISISSTPGSGTRIDVRIPVTLSHQAEASGDQTGLMQIDDNLTTLLVAEDNEQMRDYLCKKLAPRFNVIPASNGAEAFAAVERYVPEIVITDVIMPEMDGLALCKKIKQNSRYSDILVFLLSAKASVEDELAAYRDGADVFIRKPFDAEILQNQIINIHATRQSRKSQLLADLLSKEDNEIEFHPREIFIKRSMRVVEEYMMDSEFKIDRFASEMNMSNTVLHRKFRLFVGQTPNQFIRLVRLRKSVSLLRNSDLTIAEIAHLTGFNQSHYFIKCFREVYNDTPKNFREQLREQP